MGFWGFFFLVLGFFADFEGGFGCFLLLVLFCLVGFLLAIYFLPPRNREVNDKSRLSIKSQSGPLFGG